MKICIIGFLIGAKLFSFCNIWSSEREFSHHCFIVEICKVHLTNPEEAEKAKVSLLRDRIPPIKSLILGFYEGFSAWKGVQHRVTLKSLKQVWGKSLNSLCVILGRASQRATQMWVKELYPPVEFEKKTWCLKTLRRLKLNFFLSFKTESSRWSLFQVESSFGFKCIRNPLTPRAWLSPKRDFIFTSWSKFSSVAPSAEWSLKEIPHWIACCQEEEMRRLEEGWHVKQSSAAVSGIQSATAKFRSEK